VSRRLVDAAPCPLVVVSHDAGIDTPCVDGDELVVMVAFDGSPHAERALRWASDLARAAGGRLLLAHVAPEGPVRDEAALTEFARECPGVDLQQLSACVREVRKDRLAGRTSRHYRDLFRLVKAALDALAPPYNPEP
jgi:nucleotide-binding universal stress UspA family protein